MRIYTKTGDTGETGLFDGTRVSKADARVDAYGEVDELNAWLGVVRARSAPADSTRCWCRIQRDLFALGARLADPRHQIAARVEKAALDADRRHAARAVDRHARGRRCRRCAGSSSPAARRPARSCTSRARSAGAPSAASSRSARTRSIRSSSPTSTACPTCCLSWPARPTSARASRNRVVIDAAYARVPSTCAAGAALREFFGRVAAAAERRLRPHIAAIYAFARIADDFADEGHRSDAARLALLDDWRRGCTKPRRRRPRDERIRTQARFFSRWARRSRATCCRSRRSSSTICSARSGRTCTSSDTTTWTELLDYCRRSANPVGRLVLRVRGHRDGRLDGGPTPSARALQLTNFWQDLERDWKTAGSTCPRPGPRRRAPTSAISPARPQSRMARGPHRSRGKTRELFRHGQPIADAVNGRLRWELRATWLGGMRILDRLEATGFDVFRARPTLGWRTSRRASAWRHV